MTRLHLVLQRRSKHEDSALAHTSEQASTSGRCALMEGLERRMLLSTTWTVTTLNDMVADDRRLSLREAISMSASGDTINFSPRLNATIVLQNGELAIANKNLRIIGAGRLTVSGNDASRVFHITGGTVNFKGLTIADGLANGLSDSQGGGIRNDSGTVRLTNCTVTGCAAESGGGIESYSGSLALSGCTISSNTTSGGDNGGGIDVNGGSATITSCTFSGNHASVSGGGVSVAGGTTLTLTNSTFDGNTAINGGGLSRSPSK